MEAGRKTIGKLLQGDLEGAVDEAEDEPEEDLQIVDVRTSESEFKNFSEEERASLERCQALLKEGGNRDPKLEAVVSYLLGRAEDTDERWLDRGCILFSQYFDTANWIGEQLAASPEFAEYDIGLYAGSGRSGFWRIRAERGNRKHQQIRSMRQHARSDEHCRHYAGGCVDERRQGKPQPNQE